MIQRIQSLYLTLVILLSLSLLPGTLISFKDSSGTLMELSRSGNLADMAGVSVAKLQNFWLLTVILILISLTALIAILMYKKRKIQLSVTMLLIVFSSLLILMLIYYAYMITDNYKASIIPGFKMALPVLVLVFSFAGYRGILKDDRLVRSYDRLR
jgi:hypothetical protein